VDLKVKGKRTYASIIAIVLTVLAASFGDIEVLTPEITGGLVSVLGLTAAYFRSKA